VVKPLETNTYYDTFNNNSVFSITVNIFCKPCKY
jgi:hypothetical protein